MSSDRKQQLPAPERALQTADRAVIKRRGVAHSPSVRGQRGQATPSPNAMDLRDVKAAIARLRGTLEKRVLEASSDREAAVDQDRLLLVHAVYVLVEEFQQVELNDNPKRRSARMRSVRQVISELGHDDPFGRANESGDQKTKLMFLATMGQAIDDTFDRKSTATSDSAFLIAVREALRLDVSENENPAATALAQRFIALIKGHREYRRVVRVIPHAAPKLAANAIIKYAATLEGPDEKPISIPDLCAYVLWGLEALTVQQRSEFFASLTR